MFNKVFNFLSLANNSSKEVILKEKPINILDCDLSEQKYRTEFKEWMTNYLNKSNNLTEKKYKLLFIHIFLNEKNAYIYDILPESTTLIKDIGKELIDNNESQFHIEYLFKIEPFKKGKFSISEYYKDSEDDDNFFFINDFIKEDKNNFDKLNIAKQVYKDFENVGLLGNALINANISSVELIAEMQNFKLNLFDTEKIKNRLISIKKSSYKYLNYMCYSDEHILNNLILNEENIEALTVLKSFYEYHNSISSSEDDFDFINFNKSIKMRIEYLTLNQELISSKNEQDKTVAKKIKI
jgi:hypothetical protein